MSTTRTITNLFLAILALSLAAPAAQPAVASGGSARTGILESGTHSAGPPVRISDPGPPPTAMLAGATVYAETSEQVALVTEALARFAEEGLELPDVTIHLHSDRAKCAGSSGVPGNGYYTTRGDEHIVHTCGSPAVLYHELGHVWDRYNLDDDTRNAIMEQRGLVTWSHEVWNQACGEHLASIIAWALEGSYPASIGYFDLADLDATYELATGRRSPFMIEHGL
jgi:hypothetical protein